MKIIVLIFLLSLTVTAEASGYPAMTYVAKHQKAYIVSGVLRKGDAELSIRLVHSKHFASNADEALGMFSREVLNKFSGYSILTTLVSEDETPVEKCGVSI